MFCCIHQMDSLGIFEKSNSEFHYIPELIYQSSLLSQVVKVLCRANYRAARRRRRFWGVFLSFLRAKPSKRFEVLRIPPPSKPSKSPRRGGVSLAISWDVQVQHQVKFSSELSNVFFLPPYR